MKWLRDLGIASKLFLAFGLVLVLTVALGIFSLTRIAIINQVAVEVAE